MGICTHCTDEQLSMSIKFIEKRLGLCFKKHGIDFYNCHLFLNQGAAEYSAIVELSLLDTYQCEMKVYGSSLSKLCVELLKRVERQIEKMMKNHTPYRDRSRAPAAPPWYGGKPHDKPLFLYKEMV